jgi:hypothetical protein
LLSKGAVWRQFTLGPLGITHTYNLLHFYL